MNVSVRAMKFGVGQPHRRGEDAALITGHGRYTAKDAAEGIEIEWEPLPAIADTKGAVADGAPLVWNERKHNVTFSAEHGDAAATARAFAGAAKVVKIEIVNQRIVTNFMEPRGAIAEPGTQVGSSRLAQSDQPISGKPEIGGEGRLTLTASTQGS